MMCYFRILVFCTVVGLLLPAVLLISGGVLAGGLKGFLVGVFVSLGEWKVRHAAVRSIKGVNA